MPTDPDSLEELTIAAALARQQAGEQSAEELTQAYLDRIATVDGSLNSVLAVSETALDRARELDATRRASGPAGPLHGVPVVLKDNIETADMPTTFGSIAMDGYRPPRDATVAARLRAAGAILLAKTTLPDWATSWFSYSSKSGETRNPYDTGRDPGGSSSGTGAAVAANLALAGLGTDCGGSVRLPASFCNLVGVRSTPGVVPRTGTSYLVIPQDTVGPMARTVTDAAALFDVVAGYDPADAYSVAAELTGGPVAPGLDPGALAGARVGLLTSAVGEHPDVTALVRGAAGDLRAAGAEVVEVELDGLMEHIVATSMYTDRSKADLDRFLAERADAPIRSLQEAYDAGAYDPRLDLMDAIMEGPDHPEGDPGYLGRFAARHEFTLAVLGLFAAHGLAALCYPTAQVPPPTLDGRADWTTLTFPTNTLIASQTWLPALTVPAGFTPDGAPVGLELVGRPYCERALFAAAFAYEQASLHRRAPVTA